MAVLAGQRNEFPRWRRAAIFGLIIVMSVIRSLAFVHFQSFSVVQKRQQVDCVTTIIAAVPIHRRDNEGEIRRAASTNRKRGPTKTSNSLRKETVVRLLEALDSPGEIEEWIIAQQRQRRGRKHISSPPWRSWKVGDLTEFIKFLQRQQAYSSVLLVMDDLDGRRGTAGQLVKVYTTALFAISPYFSTNEHIDRMEIAWSIMNQMDRNHVEPTSLTFLALLNIAQGSATVLETIRQLERRYPNVPWDREVFHTAIYACRRGKEDPDKVWQSALYLMQQMQRKHRIKLTSKTYAAVLEVFTGTGKIPIVRSIVRQWRSSRGASRTGREGSKDEYEDRIYAAALNACAKVGDYCQATEFLQEMSTEPNLRHCTALLRAFATAGRDQLVSLALDSMTRKNETPILLEVPGCQDPLYLPRIDPDLVALNIVISTAVKAGRYDDARHLFDRIKRGDFVDPTSCNDITAKLLSPDRISYHSLLAGCKNPVEAVRIIKEMRLSRRHRYGSIPPNSVTYAHAIQVCQRSDQPDLNRVNLLLELAKDDRVEPTNFMFGSAIWTAQRCGNLDRCLELYEEMEMAGCPPNDVTMNGILSALCDSGDRARALAMFDHIKSQRFQITAVTFKRLVALIESDKDSSTGEKKEYLMHILNRMDENERQAKIGSSVFSALMYLHGSTGDLDEALNISNRIVGYMDAPCLRALLYSYATCPENRWFEAVELLHTSDIIEGSPGPGLIDQIALSHVLLACSKADKFDEGLSLLQLYGIPTNKLPASAPSLSVVAMNALIASSGRCGCPDISLALLNEMHSRFGIRPDSRSYRSAVVACNQAQHRRNCRFCDGRDYSDDEAAVSGLEWWEICLALLLRMKEEGLTPDVQTYSSVISACEAAGQWQRALSVLQTIIDEDKSGEKSLSLNLYCWNAAISACEKGGAWVEALDLYERMLEAESFMPNIVTMNSLLESLDNNGQREHAQSKYDEGLKLGIISPWKWTKNIDGEPIQALDLHRFSAAMTRAAIRNILDGWLDETNSMGGGLTADLVIITGKGLNSVSTPVLQEITREVLLEYGIEPQLDKTNSGRMIVGIGDLLECFGKKSWR